MWHSSDENMSLSSRGIQKYSLVYAILIVGGQDVAEEISAPRTKLQEHIFQC